MAPPADSQALVHVVDDDPIFRTLLAGWLKAGGYAVEASSDGAGCLNQLRRRPAAAVCLDLLLPNASGLEILKSIKNLHPNLPVVLLTGHGTVESAVQAVQAGAYDYLTKPIDRPKLLTTVRNAVEAHRLATTVARLEQDDGGMPGMVGQSTPMRELYRQIRRVAPSRISVLIHGETGTGKELVARALHQLSDRASGPFIALNCAAMPETLLDSELFGHERNAFTGAAQRHAGKFEQAHGGTLFLDEVAELSPSMQAKLLRVLQERTFYRVGGRQEVTSDFRLLAASHRDLGRLSRENLFREDLYFRVAVFELRVPPLRERGGDTVDLARFFVQQQCLLEGRPAPALHAEAAAEIRAFDWPGNVRQLQNVMLRALLLCDGQRIRAQDLTMRVGQDGPGDGETALPTLPDDDQYQNGTVDAGPQQRPAVPPEGLPAQADTGERSLAAVERRAIVASYRRHGGNVMAMMRELEVGRTTLYRKLKDYGLR